MDEMAHESLENSFYSIEMFSVLGTNTEQEDAVGCVLGDMSAVLVLCDGMGGMKGGRVSAQAAVQKIKELAEDEDWVAEPQQFIEKAIEIADETVFFLKDDSGKRIGGGCTVLITLVIGRRIYYGNVGDSRIYYFDGDSFRQLSQDHNYGEQLKRRLALNEIDEAEYQREISNAAALTGYLGLGEIKEMYISENPVLLDRNQVFCLQSDGLYKLLNDEEMKEVICNNVKDLEKAGQNLLRKAEENRGQYQDNTSFILLRLK